MATIVGRAVPGAPFLIQRQILSVSAAASGGPPSGICGCARPSRCSIRQLLSGLPGRTRTRLLSQSTEGWSTSNANELSGDRFRPLGGFALRWQLQVGLPLPLSRVKIVSIESGITNTVGAGGAVTGACTFVVQPMSA